MYSRCLAGVAAKVHGETRTSKARGDGSEETGPKRSDLYEVQLSGPGDSPCAARGVQFPRDVVDMDLGGTNADEQGLGDLPIRQARRQKSKYFYFAVAQEPVRWGRTRRPPSLGPAAFLKPDDG